MDGASTVNLVALVISVAALATSSLIAWRQTRLMTHANQLPAVVGLFAEYRSPEFHDHYDWVVKELPALHAPDAGISGLPREARVAVLDVTYYYTTFALLIALGILDEQRFAAIFRHRMTVLWNAIEPYVVAERALNPAVGDDYLLAMEHFADTARALPPDALRAVLRDLRAP